MTRIISGGLTAALIAVALAGAASWIGLRDADGGRWGWLPRGSDLSPVNSERYRIECGGCHFAYPPGLLPTTAWGRLMESLDDHFGDDASLDPEVADELLTYLTSNSADDNPSIRSRAFAARPIILDHPPRITQTAYFQRKHDRVPLRLVTENPKVGSFSNCQACHRDAERGSFNEHRVVIAGVDERDALTLTATPANRPE
ncbi:MAG TPA: diheme cytochrome c [Lamprocystis sp. (in: g-proteobacteria)]|nr:diheme cytochrome c [Lamprocystis sp. (in: g-proteobacteria)]